MLHSLFLIGSNGEVVIERHWRGVVSRTVCDHFWSEVTKRNRTDVSTFITTPKFYLANVRVGEVYFLGVLGSEVAPLMCLELLHRIAQMFESYFGQLSSESVKENFVTVYQLLDEMVDNGYPLNTEPNVLREIVMKPTLLNKMVDSMSNTPSSVSSRLPEGSVSNIPWRKQGVRYAHNEIYFDLVECLDCIVNGNGQAIHTHIWGEIQCESKLSGMPDLLVEFNDASVLEDFSFHPCIRYNRFLRSKQLSFVPPDGQFTLATYSCQRSIDLPIYAKPQISVDDDGGRVRVEVMVGSRFVGTKPLQDIVVTIPFARGLSSSTFSANVGTASFDEITKVCTWKIGKLGREVTPQLSGVLRPTDKHVDLHIKPVLQVHFKLPKETMTGLRIDNLTLVNEKYKPYKGMRCMTKSGNFEVRA